MTVFVFVGSLLGSMALGVPIAFALLASGVALMIQLGTFDAQIVAQNVVNGADSFPLMAVPFFILAGEVMTAGGLSKRIVALAMACVGHIRGGLGYVTIMAACVMASLSGSAVADAAALAVLLMPMMLASGYDRGRSAGLVSAGAIIGPIIPPSIPFIIYGVTGNVSIIRLFLAGIFPGIMLGVGLAATWYFVSRRGDITLPVAQTNPMRVRALIEAAWALVLPFIIIFGLKFGVFTPTEAGVVAAVYSIFVSFAVYRELTLQRFYEVLVQSAKVTSVVMILVACATVSAWLITIANLPLQLAGFLEPLMGNQTLLMLVIVAILLIIGMGMDLTPTILVLTPVLLPVVKMAGIDPVYFGVIFIVTGSIGLITPPVGTVLNVVCGVTKLTMEDLTKGVWPFLMTEIVILLLFVFFPKLVTVPASWFFG
jgi:tripartite ATP-independent transporter DctM subunit